MKRFLLSALAAAGLALPVATSAIAAEERTCKSEAVVRTGGTANTELLARKRARDAWRQKVEETIGDKYAAWYLAKDHDYSCFKEGGADRCKVSAVPCESAVVIQGPRKICHFYKIAATGDESTSECWAAHRARKTWSLRANLLGGVDFDTWIFANNRESECSKQANGKYVCRVLATPCRVSVIN